MIGVIIIGSIVALGVVLWIFSRLAWGGGMRAPSYDLLKPHSAATGAVRGAGLPQPDIETIELRCKQCAFVKPMPEIARTPAILTNTAIQLGDAGAIKAPCPACGGQLQSWLRRDITQRGPHGELHFGTLRRGTQLWFIIDGVTYSSLAAVPNPAQATIAAATNSNEES